MSPRLGSRSTGRCVLVCHRVVSGPLERDHDVAWPEFLTLIDRLLAAGITFARDLAAEPDDGAVVLTFDDATCDHQALGRTLAERGVPAIFFVPAGLLGVPGHLDEADLRELVEGGHVIGSHGWSHKRLDQVSEAELATEFDASRAKLEDLTGGPVTLFAPAGGIGIPSLPRRLEAAGYVASRSTRWGIYRRRSDRWSIPTVPVTPVTADRGWVASAATERRLPVAMVALGAVRDVLGPGARTALRGQLHRRHAAPPLPEDPAAEVI
jgi:Polysaccharide deacetylase